MWAQGHERPQARQGTAAGRHVFPEHRAAHAEPHSVQGSGSCALSPGCGRDGSQKRRPLQVSLERGAGQVAVWHAGCAGSQVKHSVGSTLAIWRQGQGHSDSHLGAHTLHRLHRCKASL